jgi:hypothetical protein
MGGEEPSVDTAASAHMRSEIESVEAIVLVLSMCL